VARLNGLLVLSAEGKYGQSLQFATYLSFNVLPAEELA
jgi:hypothetical protein